MSRKALPSWLNIPGRKGFVMFANSMARHPAFISMSAAARCLYTQYCMSAPHDKTRSVDIEELGGFKIEASKWKGRAFYMTWKSVEPLKIGCERAFRNAVNELLEHGFITLLFRGKRGKKNVYALSDRWWKEQK